MKNIRIPLAVALLAVLPAATCGSQLHLPARPQQTLAQELALPAHARTIEVQFLDGLLTLEPGPLRCSLQLHLVADSQDQLQQLAQEAAPRVAAGADECVRLNVSLPPGAALDSVRTTWRLAAPAGTRVVVRTRLGAVVARGAACDLAVDGGSGVVEAQMAGGSAAITSTSGSVILRGDYDSARIASALGRIDLQLPSVERRDVAIAVASKKGDVYVDLRKGQSFAFLFAGEERLVHCDPEVRVVWQPGRRQVEGTDYLEGMLGDPAGAATGSLRLEAQGPVYVRLQPDGAVAGD